MTDEAPERIWLDWPAANKGDPVYDEPPERDTQPGQTGYRRADAPLPPAEALRLCPELAGLVEQAARNAEAWVRRAMHLSPDGYEIERQHGHMAKLAGDEIRATLARLTAPAWDRVAQGVFHEASAMPSDTGTDNPGLRTLQPGEVPVSSAPAPTDRRG